MNRKKLIIFLDGILIVLTLAVIFGNSIFSKEQSNEISREVFGFLSAFLDKVFGEGVITHAIIRKVAHFLQFFLLGLECSLLSIMIFNVSVKRFISLLPFGLIVSFVDEGIQILSQRGASIIDVAIDLVGYIVASGLLCLILFYNKERG